MGRAASRLSDVLSGDGTRVSSFIVLRAVAVGAAGLNAVGFSALLLRVMIHGVG